MRAFTSICMPLARPAPRIPPYLAAAVVLLTACGPGRGGHTAQPEAPGTLTSLEARVQAELGEPVCDDVSECRTMAFGTKPCGGPWSYLVYSIRTTDSTRMEEAVARYNRLEATLNREEGRMSDCSIVAAPQLACVAGRCTAR